MIKGKYEIELNCVGEGEDHRKFLNFWDWAHGNDVTAEIIRGELFVTKYLDDGSEGVYKITFPEFLDLVYESVSKRQL